jgi:subtilisin family serine protease
MALATRLTKAAIDAVTAAGALVVVAAGNAGAPVTRPADCRGVLAVTAVRGDGAKASYGSYGPTVGLGSAGRVGLWRADDGIYTTLNDGRRGPTTSSYGPMVGTSFSAPLASGVAALVLSIQPGLSGAAVSSLLVGHVRPHTRQANLATCSAQAISQGACNCTTQTCGSGLLDVDLALAAAQSSLPTLPVTPPVPTTPVKPHHAEFRGWRWRNGWPVGCRVVAVVVGCTPQPDQEQACSVLPLRTSGGMSFIKRLKRSCRASVASGSLKV